MSPPWLRYQPKYFWKGTQIDEEDPRTDFDWFGFNQAIAETLS